MGIQRGVTVVLLAAAALAGGLVTAAAVQVQEQQPPEKKAPFDAVADAQTPRQVPVKRPEQKKSEHDKSDIFSMDAARSTAVLISTYSLPDMQSAGPRSRGPAVVS